ARELATQGALAMNVLMEKALAQPGMRDRAKEVAAYAKQVADELKHARVEHLDRFDSVDEFAMFRENAHFLPKDLGVKLDVVRANDRRCGIRSTKVTPTAPGGPA